MDYLATKYLRSRKIPSTACSGCGLGQIHKVIVEAIDEIGLGIEDIIWATGIGCAGRQTFATWKGDCVAGTHGRIYAIVTGLRLALPPEKKIVITAGDGDAFGIGISHLLNAARRNVGMTVVVCDNLGFQSTGGQYAWTTPEGAKTDSSPYGMFEPNWIDPDRDILKVLKEAGATFLARHISVEGEFAVQSMKKALLNNGFSLVHMPYPCPTNFGATELGSRDPSRILKWMESRTARIGEKELSTGVYWRTGIYHDASNSRPEFSQYMREKVGEIERRYHQ